MHISHKSSVEISDGAFPGGHLRDVSLPIFEVAMTDFCQLDFSPR
jgi:hypothetical protein